MLKFCLDLKQVVVMELSSQKDHIYGVKAIKINQKQMEQYLL